MLGVALQTRDFGGKRNHNPHPSNLASNSLISEVSSESVAKNILSFYYIYLFYIILYWSRRDLVGSVLAY